MAARTRSPVRSDASRLLHDSISDSVALSVSSSEAFSLAGVARRQFEAEESRLIRTGRGAAVRVGVCATRRATGAERVKPSRRARGDTLRLSTYLRSEQHILS